MGALPRPDIPTGPHHELVAALHDLHHRAGWPSLRQLAREAGCSHTTVSNVFSAPRLPPWGVLELIVEAMDGTVAGFRELWLAAGRQVTPESLAVPRIAGRRDELDAVRRHLDSGSGGLMLVTGEAGIGKTALVTAAAGGVETYVATGACRPLSADVPLLPVTDLLRQVRRDGPDWFDHAMTDSPAYVPGALAQVLPELAGDEAPPVSEEWARQRLFNAVEALLTALRKQRPLALLVEDAHWADATTLDVLELLGGHRFPMIVTVRTDDPDVGEPVSDWLTRVRRLPGATSLALAPLTLAETTQQLAILRGTTPAPDEVARVHARSLGQPLFTEQLALHPDDRPMPGMLADLLGRRLRELGPDAWSVARALGVADRPLQVGQLTEVAGLDPVAGLRELARRRLLAASDGPVVRLRHPLIADAIREHLVPGEAPEVHRRVADVLAALPDPPAAEIADHWFVVGDDGHELHWRIQAARAAAAAYAVEAAAAQWRRVLALWPDDLGQVADPPLTRAGMYVAVLDAVERLDFAALPALMSDALQVVEGAGPEEAGAILMRAGQLRGWLGDHEAHLELTAKAVAMLAGLPPSRDRIVAFHAMRSALEGLGRFKEAADAGLRALAEARLVGTPSDVKDALAQRVWAQSVAGDTAGARTTIDELRGIELDSPDPYCEIGVAVNLTDALLMSGAPAHELVDVAQPALAAAHRWGLHQWADAILRYNVAEALLAQGDPDQAWDLVAPYSEGDPADQERWPLFEQRAALELMRGHPVEARRIITALETGPLPRGGLAFRLTFAVTAAAIDLWSGRPADAFDRSLPVLESGQDTEQPGILAPLLVLAARAAADLRDGARGARLRGLHRGLTGDPFAPHPTLATAEAQGATWASELARLARRDTVDAWVAAAGSWDRHTHPYDAAYCRWRAALVGLATGRGTAAGRLLKQAAVQARGHVPLAEAVHGTAGGSNRRELGAGEADLRRR